MIPEIQIILQRILSFDKSRKTNSIKPAKIEKYFLFRELYQKEAKIGRDWAKIYPVALDLGLIKEKAEHRKVWTIITEKGVEFESMIEDSLTLTTQQKRFLLKNCILGKNEFLGINQFVKTTEIGKNGFEIYLEDLDDLRDLSARDFRIIAELGLREFVKDEEKAAIPKDFADIVDDHKQNRDEVSEPDFDAAYKDQKAVGDKAEEFAVKYERLFLKDNGTKEQVEKFNELNSKENIIAIRNIRAGYDVQSFRNKKSKVKNPDKNIEVKGRKRKVRSFIISSGEVKKGIQYSKQKDREHWIYFYWNIEKKKKTNIDNLNDKEKQDFLEPAAKIPFEKLNIKLCKNCLKYLVKVDEFI
jgi:hypothetical protein